ncbi:polysaccharide biosynthesis protein, partial [Klebsiella oxytoca]
EANIFSLVCTLITTPYMALIIAHENMDVYAVISIIEAALKVFVVIAVGRMPGDKLAMYGILTALSTFAITF